MENNARWQWYERMNPSTPDNPEEFDCFGWQCSGCGIDLAEYLKETTQEIVYLDVPYIVPTLNFCPNCGKKMEKMEAASVTE